MATSGTIYGSPAGNGNYLYIEWSETATSIPNNTSTVKATVKLYNRYGSYSSGDACYWYVTIDGTKYDGYIYYWSGTPVTVGTATKTVTHNANGSKSITISAYFDTAGTSTGTVTASGTATLTTLPRYATCSQSVASKTESSITMNWASDSAIDYVWYSANNGSSWIGIWSGNAKSGSYTISGLSVGTSYNIKTRVRRKDSQLTTDSSSMAVATYSYPYANSMPNFTLGNSVTIGIFNPMGHTVTVQLKDANNNIVSTVSNISGTSVSGFNGSSVVDALYQSIPNAKYGIYKVDVIYGSSTITKTGGKYNINENECKPVIGSATYRDIDTNVTAITQNDQNIVRNWSDVRYTASNLEAKKYSTLASCSVAVNGNTYNLTLSGTTAQGGDASINSGTDVDAVFTLTDSRGLSVTKTIKITMSDWQIPSGIITIQRRNNFYSETDINVDANYSYIDGHNSVTITYQAKKQGSSTWDVSGTLQDNVTALVSVDNNYAWDFQIIITDAFGGTVTYNTSIARGMPIAFFDRLKNAFSIECFPSAENVIEVDGDYICRVDTTASSGTDYDLYQALLSLGWEDLI